MSPIGRVFIVLNLILAGVFVGFAGTFLQRQDNWKDKQIATQKEMDQLRTETTAENSRLRDELAAMQNSKTAVENQYNATKADLDGARDEVKRLESRLASVDGDVKKMASTLEAQKTEIATAFKQAKDAFEMAIADQKAKDESVRSKDVAEAENRDLKNEIASLKETISNKDVEIASLTKDKNELGLLVDVAQAKGFTPSMAVPQLAGTVSRVDGRLCTISITDNPANAEVKPGYSFAIYDASGYKGEAQVTSVDKERNAAFCTLRIQNGQVREGDKASTHLAGTN